MPTISITVYNGIGTGGSVLATRSALTSAGMFDVAYVDFTGVPFVVGSDYTAMFTDDESAAYLNAFRDPVFFGASEVDLYAGGNAIVGGLPRLGDFYFSAITTNPPPPFITPEPSAMFLLGTVIALCCGGLCFSPRRDWKN